MAERAALKTVAARALPEVRAALLELPTVMPWWRLQAAVLLQGAGQTEEARLACRDFIVTMGPPSRDLRGLRETVAQVALRLGEYDVLHHYVRVCYGADLTVRLGHGPRHQTRGTVQWTLHGGHSTFTFSETLLAHVYFNTVVKHFALELPLLLGYATAHPFVSGTVPLSLEDIGHRAGLAFCENRLDYFLVPDPFFVGTEGYAAVRQTIDAGRRPWSERRSRAFWRGNSTGWLNCAGGGIATWRELPRAVLCELAQNGPDAKLYDVGLSGIAQLAPEAADEARASGLLRDYVKLGDLSHAKYQIDIDGNSNAWMGLYAKLYSGSPVLKVRSAAGFRQWYYDRLIPWWNYVPVRRDMADLTQKLLWLMRHDDAAQAIGERGRALALSMGFDQECTNAHATITAAFRHAGFMNRDG